ncbi:uncharacterized protein RHOBADRAFT_51119 [Rhodotorula graminis WP1]|uniref:HMG box domain-containing protein n=1 Tax=Rhodotorula graminis (strain WP1) TaxID=578459 RepID=A0A194SD68_RHOGW|nr:uncharacterized protein RHOBADRAFT_51119 [Rhodotorula graminis WP1]KPV78683.1 hypothetical protein RHOBADRAFT_51119 [Rhodotorula graminis WP1]
MSPAQYPPSPPSSTSLPEHWQFVPPPTDGPNTRARRAQGLQPYSGTSAPLPSSVVARGPQGAGAGAGYGAAEEEHGGDWDSWPQGGDSQQPQYWCSAGPSSSGATYYMIDPALSFDSAQPPPPPLPPSSFPPPPSSTAYSQQPHGPHDRDDDHRRVFSTASVIDHGSPPDSPGSTPALPDLPEELELEPVVAAKGLPAIGISKEEWLRLGGFEPESPGEARPAPTLPRRAVEPQYAAVIDEHDDVFHTPPRQHPHSAQPYPPHGPSWALPPPPASAPPLATYTLPPVHASSTHPHNPFAAAPHHPLPPTPSVFASPKREPAESSWPSSRPPTRSSLRNAPSPVDPTRLRPEPYPTSSSASWSATSPRNLTPVSTALALYACHPVPSAPPVQSTYAMAKKKKHGRKFSDNHVPRPRNAFILFRSHAVSTDLIPKSMGITDHKNISQVVGSVWRGLSPVERKKWEDLAAEEKRLHSERYPEYKYQPKQRRPRAPVGSGKKAMAKAAKLAENHEPAVAAVPDVADDIEVNSDAAEDESAPGAASDPDFEVAPSPRRPRRKSTAAANSRSSPLKRRSKRPSLHKDVDPVREQRRMELIGQAMLEGEDDEAIIPRVEAELAAEERALGDIAVVSSPSPSLSTSPAKPPSRTRSSPVKPGTSAVTPRKTRSSIHQRLTHASSPVSPDIVVRSGGGGPAYDSDSTLSPSPHCRARLAGSPASSTSPSPQRMQQPGGSRARSPPSSSGARHPLSRSVTRRQQGDDEYGEGDDDDLPASCRTDKARSYASAALGVAAPSSAHDDPQYTFPLPPLSQLGPASLGGPLNTPFAGAADSRQFSLGRWELRKPSAAVASRRELLAAQEEDALLNAASIGPGSSTSGWLDRTASSMAPASSSSFVSVDPQRQQATPPPTFSLDPHEFLAASGLDDAANDALSEYGTAAGSVLWDDSASSTTYETAASSAPTRSTSRYGGLSVGTGAPGAGTGRLPLFRAPSTASAASSSAFGGGGAGCGSAFSGEVDEPAFHFGEVDLFAHPPSAFGTAERTVSSVFGPPPSMASVVEDCSGELAAAAAAQVGLGIRFDGREY